MDHLPDLKQAEAILSRMHSLEAKDQQVFSARVDQEEAAVCQCTLCPSRDQEEQYDYCCQSLFRLPLRKNGQHLREGLKEKLRDPSTPCICLNPLFSNFLLTDTATNAAVALRNYETGTVDMDENRSRRFACYRLIIATVMGPLGRGIRVRLPACIISEVRKRWPSHSNTGFKPSDVLDD
ncbi:hypothetical protein PENTCL1PPCAC_23886 [Pristionchus entomophagus]|uniref:Ribosomal protein n=1 Tax=Pristionchus entomophagus TaxID=358040 RepID=A0AAV5U5B8_9BILA|nr:hypothetical protein PENTCL1PPCAC_23886 [Pristionchus entomophagus]